MDEYITIEEFIEEVWRVEHVKLEINFNNDFTHLVKHYPYKEPMSGDCTVDELLEQRVRPILNNIKEPISQILLRTDNW